MSMPWDPAEEPPRRDIAAIELVEGQAREARTELAKDVVGAVAQALDELAGEEAVAEGADGPRVRMQATRTAVRAVQGRLPGKSHEGARKEEQILDDYTSQRQRNANAGRRGLEPAAMLQAAFDRLKETLELLRALGIDVGPVRLPDGRLGIAIGDKLSAPPPVLALTESAPDSLPPAAPL